jgi:hypothetical protein
LDLLVLDIHAQDNLVASKGSHELQCYQPFMMSISLHFEYIQFQPGIP